MESMEAENISLDKALNFSSENFFEYIQTLLANEDPDYFGELANKDYEDIINLLSDPEAQISVQTMDTKICHALMETSKYAYRAGFIEACRLIKTLHSFSEKASDMGSN